VKEIIIPFKCGMNRRWRESAKEMHYLAITKEPRQRHELKTLKGLKTQDL
jgi:hypothetical protein